MSIMKDWKNYYKLSPRDLSGESIKTLKLTSIFGLFGSLLGLATLWKIVPLNPWVLLAIFSSLCIGMVAVFHRLPNLLSLTDKHLDEWSQKVKKDAESFTYRVILWFWFLMMFLAFLFVGGDFSGLRLILSPSLEQLLFSTLLIPIALYFITSCHMAWSIKPLSTSEVMDMYEIEKPRKYSKKMTYILIGSFILGAFGRYPANYFWGQKVKDMNETCVIKMETEISLFQLKNLNDCATLAEAKK